EWINSLAGKYGERFSSPQASAQLDRIISVMSDRLASFATRSANGIISFTVSASSATVVLFMSIIASFWFLRDLPRMSREVNVLVSPKRSDEFHTVVGICSRVAGGYIKGVLISSLITGVVSSIGFSLIGLPYAVILGTITGIMNVIPIVGPWVAGAIAAIVALFVSPLICFLSIVITVAVRFLVDSVVQPRVMSSTVNLHPGVVIIALMVGGGVAGPAGMVMAVPVTAVIKDVFAYEFERRTGRQVLGEDGALFKGRSLLEAEDSGGPDGDDVVEAPDAPDDSSGSSVPDEPGTLMGAPDEDVTPES
ncbi:MAG: AI-2E family transporter, partial [Coriobacteriales bacterium]|nr:AI-2E family transporter [Coriobacteriales bacterium]